LKTLSVSEAFDIILEESPSQFQSPCVSLVLGYRLEWLVRDISCETVHIRPPLHAKVVGVMEWEGKRVNGLISLFVKTLV